MNGPGNFSKEFLNEPLTDTEILAQQKRKEDEEHNRALIQSRIDEINRKLRENKN